VLAAFFVLAALVCFVALRWRRDPGWRPWIATSLVYAVGVVVFSVIRKSQATNQYLDDTSQLWALGVVASWLLLNAGRAIRRRRASRRGATDHLGTRLAPRPPPCD
jgi:4-amino-4-deoxy-L-arabinose transferase-like glycosyltransferase